MRRIDAPGATLLPGLIDCHVHFSLSGGPAWLDEIRDPYATVCFRSALHARQTLHAGFTTVRVLGGREGVDIALREAQKIGLVEAPRILAANCVVCMTGGHGSWMGREADGPDEVRKAVREQVKAGADCIKLMATGGVMTPGMAAGAPQLGYEELKAGVEEAHKASRRTASHAQGAEGIKAAVLAGIDSIEHGFQLTDEIIQLMVERSTFLSATLSAATGLCDAPPNTIPDWARSKMQGARHMHEDSFLRAREAGVKLVLGTDAGTPFNFHGANAQEMMLMVQNGLAPLEALRAGTRNSADLLGLLDEIGTIEVGKAADLVLCEGDPTQDVALLTEPANLRAVIQAGRVVAGSERR
jgi:imidazolonepropionase-like amidohydrolase